MKNSSNEPFDTANSNVMLGDGFLIPMTDFLLQLDTERLPEDILQEVINYAEFLKQPLKLEMFMPCDEDGNILEEPKKENYTQEELENSVMGCDYLDYNKAKEEVLFKFKPQFEISIIKHHISQGRNIEYLANFGSMQLTQNALNTIFGKTIA